MDEKEIKGIKLWQVLLIIIILLSLILIILQKLNAPRQVKFENINLNFKDQIQNGITFEKIKIYSKDNKYYFTAKAINKTKSDLKTSKVTVNIDDLTFKTYIGDVIESNDYQMIFMETEKDLSSAKNIKIHMQTQKIS